MIEIIDIHKHFPVKKGLLQSILSAFRSDRQAAALVKAVNGVSFTMDRGRIMGLAGESGCGKTTTGMLLLRLYTATAGKIIFEGREIGTLKGSELGEFRRKAQLIFQDPYESLNPRFTVARTIAEPLIVNHVRGKRQRREKISQAMQRAKLTPIEAFIDKYPHELSGGERQRVCIARAIVLEPILLVADEAVSMLDVSIRADILNLLSELTIELQMASLYISHDLSLLGSICDSIAIMYAGQIVEMGPPKDVIHFPQHFYTRALIGAVPVLEFNQRRVRTKALKGEPPDLTDLPQGCSFNPRCASALDVCRTQNPQLSERQKGHRVACHVRE